MKRLIKWIKHLKPKCSCDTCFHNCTTWCDFQSYCKKRFMESDKKTDKRLEKEAK